MILGICVWHHLEFRAQGVYVNWLTEGPSLKVPGLKTPNHVVTHYAPLRPLLQQLWLVLMHLVPHRDTCRYKGGNGSAIKIPADKLAAQRT